MKKLCSILAVMLTLGAVAGCGSEAAQDAKVELTVVTPFSESDGNRKNFVSAYKAYE